MATLKDLHVFVCPGDTTVASCKKMKPAVPKGYCIPFDSR